MEVLEGEYTDVMTMIEAIPGTHRQRLEEIQRIQENTNK